MKGPTVRVPNMWGKDVGKEGAAWMAGKLILPMLSSSVRPKMAFMLLNVTHLRAGAAALSSTARPWRAVFAV